MAEDIRNTIQTAGIQAFEKKYENPDVILVDSQYCSMGRMIAVKACENTEYTYYDSVLLLELVKDTGITISDVEQFEKQLRSKTADLSEMDSELFKKIQNAFILAISRATTKGKCLIHDRATVRMIQDLNLSCISVMIRNSGTHTKCIRASKSPLYQTITDEDTLMTCIQEEDHIRRNWKKLCGEDTWNISTSYDLILDSEVFTRDFSAQILHQLMI